MSQQLHQRAHTHWSRDELRRMGEMRELWSVCVRVCLAAALTLCEQAKLESLRQTKAEEAEVAAEEAAERAAEDEAGADGGEGSRGYT